MSLAAPLTRRGEAGVLTLLGLALFAIPLAFERLTPQPLLIDVGLLNLTSFSLVRQAYPDADLMNGLVLATGPGLALMVALLAWKGYRRVLVRSRLAVRLAAAGAVAFLSTLALDFFVSVTRHEDPLESVSSPFFVTAFVVLTLDLLARPEGQGTPA